MQADNRGILAGAHQIAYLKTRSPYRIDALYLQVGFVLGVAVLGFHRPQVVRCPRRSTTDADRDPARPWRITEAQVVEAFEIVARYPSLAEVLPTVQASSSGI